jgi:sulfite reductase (NADPH) flavoprotein alpha-component
MILTNDMTRLALTAGCFAGYGLVCLLPYLRQRRKRTAARAEAAQGGWLVAYASQTGNAEALAQQTAASLRLAGIAVRTVELSGVDQAALLGAERALFIVSTYGEGDAPDAGAGFAGRLMTREVALPGMHYAVLALGDSSYSHFCGFGRALDGWLAAQGAQPLFERIEVDRSNAVSIGHWRQQLSHLAGTSDAPDWGAPAFAGWRLAARRIVNPGSAGAPLAHLELEIADGALPDWQSGDLAQIAPPSDPEHARDYSISSIPADGRVHLLVRLHTHADGSHGAASGWLHQAALGIVVPLRLRQHPRFRLEGNAARPLLLIGNGSGMAGLRGHLKARARAGMGRNWLLFGERNAAHDAHYSDELQGWRDAGLLERCDFAWSRDEGVSARYVQDLLPQHAEALRAWNAAGAAIYVCGSLDGMAAGVDAALREVLGDAALNALAEEGRYRRDVY